jgi:hypothetical protein
LDAGTVRTARIIPKTMDVCDKGPSIVLVKEDSNFPFEITKEVIVAAPQILESYLVRSGEDTTLNIACTIIKHGLEKDHAHLYPDWVLKVYVPSDGNVMDVAMKPIHNEFIRQTIVAMREAYSPGGYRPRINAFPISPIMLYGKAYTGLPEASKIFLSAFFIIAAEFYMNGRIPGPLRDMLHLKTPDAEKVGFIYDNWNKWFSLDATLTPWMNTMFPRSNLGSVAPEATFSGADFVVVRYDHEDYSWGKSADMEKLKDFSPVRQGEGKYTPRKPGSKKTGERYREARKGPGKYKNNNNKKKSWFDVADKAKKDRPAE